MKVGDIYPTKTGDAVVVLENDRWDKVKVRFLSNGYFKVVTRSCIKRSSIARSKLRPFWKGEVFENNKGSIFIVDDYINSSCVDIRFNSGYTTRTSRRNILSGNVKDKLYPSVYGVGFIGVGVSLTKGNPQDKVSRAYKKWSGMLKRCYDTHSKNTDRSYIDCYVAEEWHNFQNFYEWYESKVNEYRFDWELDKDLLIKGNKVYSENTCTLLPKLINTTLTKNDACRSREGIGATIRASGRYRSSSLKATTFTSKEQAFQEYKNCKEGRLSLLAVEFKSNLEPEAFRCLTNYKVEEGD